MRPEPRQVDGREFTRHRFGNVEVLLPAPDAPRARRFVGREDLIKRCRAAWLDADGGGALHFQLVGPPGVGKNALVEHLAMAEKKPLFVLQGSDDMSPQDIAVSGRINEDNRVDYVGSPLLAAMVYGGIAFFDEIGKAPHRALSLLSALLDHRSTLSPAPLACAVRAHPEFRFCCAMNEADAATSGLPRYLDERLRPRFEMAYPPQHDLVQIVRNAVPKNETLLDEMSEWLRQQEAADVRISPREAISVATFAARLARCDPKVNGCLTTSAARRLIDEAAAVIVQRDKNSTNG